LKFLTGERNKKDLRKPFLHAIGPEDFALGTQTCATEQK
jgi:hypothetical protein